MNVWPNNHHHSASAHREQISATRHSRPIEVDGVFLGAAIEHELGVRFIAVDVRVTEMNQSIWPSVDYAYRSARQLFRSNQREMDFDE
jgi:hypothetical protein